MNVIAQLRKRFEILAAQRHHNAVIVRDQREHTWRITHLPDPERRGGGFRYAFENLDTGDVRVIRFNSGAMTNAHVLRHVLANRGIHLHRWDLFWERAAFALHPIHLHLLIGRSRHV